MRTCKQLAGFCLMYSGWCSFDGRFIVTMTKYILKMDHVKAVVPDLRGPLNDVILSSTTIAAAANSGEFLK